LAFQIIS